MLDDTASSTLVRLKMGRIVSTGVWHVTGDGAGLDHYTCVQQYN